MADSSIMDIILSDAYDLAIEERKQFFGDITNLMLEFIKANNVTVASNYNIIPSINSEKKLIFESYKFTLFHENAFSLCSELGKFLFNKTKTKLLVSKKISFNEYELKYDNIVIAIIYGIPIYQQQNLIEIMGYEKINDYYVLPCEIEIINCYKKISELNNEEDIYFLYEKELYKRFLTKTTTINSKEGGAEDSITDLRYDIVNSLIMKYGCLLGSYAIQLYENNFNKETHKIIFDKPFEALVEMNIENILLYLKNIINLEITFKENTSKLPFDFRNKRYSLYDENENLICNIYNEATYSVIPFIKLTYKDRVYNVANQATIMKYLFINLWLDKFRFLIKGKKVNNDKRQVELINIMHKHYEQQYDVDIFYIGVYINEVVAKKKFTMDKGSYPYYFREHVAKLD